MMNSWLKARLVRSIFHTDVELPLFETTEIVTSFAVKTAGTFAAV